ncbi:MAG: hypothetical protein QGG50_01795 [Methanopyri archaeon]|nr:hypothetical protein [Methanopyri archaeon]|tara:strand:- start:848 stop:1921 length:1074 start_codon:yes stop_codon:yes gene_type:complete
MTIRIGIVGLGYLSSCFLYGLALHREGRDIWTCLTNPVRDVVPVPLDDIELVRVFDIDGDKVGKSVGEVIRKYYPLPKGYYDDIIIEEGVCVERDHVVKNIVSIWDHKKRGETEMYLRGRMKDLDVLAICSTTEPDVDMTSSKVYSLYALQEGVSVINGIPTPICGDEEYDYLARENKAVLMGNDFASGATPLTHDLLCHLSQHGRIPLNIAQWQYASNTDFLSLSDSSGRGAAKKRSKSRIITTVYPGVDIPHYIGIDYIPPAHMDPDTKHMYMNIHYNTFAGTTNFITITARISDSPSASVLLADMIRLVPLAKEKGDFVPQDLSAFFFKSGPVLFPSRIEAFNRILTWIGAEDQ